MKKTLLKIMCLFLIFLLLMVPQGLTYAENNAESFEMHGFYPSFTSYSADLQKYIDRLDSVSFAWSRIYADAPDLLNTTKGLDGNYSFYYPQDYKEPLKYAKSKGKSIQLSIFADRSNSEKLLTDENKRNIVIQTILKALSQDAGNGEGIYYDGVVIDFESMRNTDGKGNDVLFYDQHISDYFNRFLSDLNTELDRRGKKLYVAVNPSLYYDGYDYGEIVKIADKMIIMAHDYEPVSALTKSQITQYTGYDSLNPADSLAPVKKVGQALEDVKNSVDDLKKVWLQIAFDSSQWQYGIQANRDWDSMDGSVMSKGNRSTPSYQMIKNRIDNKDGKGSAITYGYNNELQCPFIQYYNTADKTQNIIIYEDSKSVGAKIDLAKAYGIGGISIWSLGNIPDYNDAKGKSFHLDVWDNLLSAIQKPYSPVAKEHIKMQFADKKVEEAVRKNLSKPSGDIYKDDVAGIYRFKLPEGVKSLNDLKAFTNLEYLDAQNLAIKDMKALSSLTNLRILYLQRNQIADVAPLKTLTKLQVLSLNGNKISNISALAGLKELRELYLGENQISSITSLAGLTKIGKLNLNSNKITDISSISKMSSLYELSLEGNLVSSLKPVTSLVKLIYLNAAGNKVKDIDAVKYLKKLECLYLQRNLVENISPLKSNKEIKILSLNGNQIKDISTLSGLTKLEELYIKDNKITSVSKLKGLKELDTLYLKGNKISDLNAIKNAFAKMTSCDY